MAHTPVHVHAACSCPCCMTVFMLLVHVQAADPCRYPFCISLSKRMFIVQPSVSCQCSMSMSTLLVHIHVDDPCPCPCLSSMYRTCCMSSPCPCPCPCCMSKSILLFISIDTDMEYRHTFRTQTWNMDMDMDLDYGHGLWTWIMDMEHKHGTWTWTQTWTQPCDLVRVWRWILLPWQCRQDFAQLITSLARLRQTNLEGTRRQEASLPGWEMLCKCQKKNVFSEFCWDFGNIANQALNACLSDSKF